MSAALAVCGCVFLNPVSFCCAILLVSCPQEHTQAPHHCCLDNYLKPLHVQKCRVTLLPRRLVSCVFESFVLSWLVSVFLLESSPLLNWFSSRVLSENRGGSLSLYLIFSQWITYCSIDLTLNCFFSAMKVHFTMLGYNQNWHVIF